MPMLFIFVFFCLVRSGLLGVLIMRRNGFLDVGDDLWHTCSPSGTLSGLLKFQLEFYWISIPSLTRRPLLVSVLVRRPITETVVIFVVALNKYRPLPWSHRSSL